MNPGITRTPRRFTIALPENVPDDLRRRIDATRWPDEPAGAGWDYLADRGYLEELLAYWGGAFDWRAQERRLNELPPLVVEIDGVEIDYVHARGREGAIPLLLLHGWPATFTQMERIVPLLVGGSPAFDVVVPSLPGYGFSSRPRERGMSVGTIASLFATLMTDILGYERFGVRSSDIGAGVAAALPHTLLLGSHTSGTNPFLQDGPTTSPKRRRRRRAADRLGRFFSRACRLAGTISDRTSLLPLGRDVSHEAAGRATAAAPRPNRLPTRTRRSASAAGAASPESAIAPGSRAVHPGHAGDIDAQRRRQQLARSALQC